ncbi:ankyrin repeat domain-containing protein [Micromonospora sp. NBC_01796]|uniref:ankyrin repeat domain-containing protein n=1 Tax=Micromonospora sp. NBC_01796 TaxID=2975987 RepID=UPI002DD8318D|nr:ankyrin repeat domain-containing protein [Micromonospora sp. NBC_01796]WSA89423.1 ankyrin repeat domain-containing protein [Micromonospora sp. NBC_01796]
MNVRRRKKLTARLVEAALRDDVLAAAWGHTDVVRALLAHGADADLREDRGSGDSPLDWALRGSHTGAAELLRAAGAHPRPSQSG